MTEEQVGMLAATLVQLSRGFREVARHIVEQEAEIRAIRSILERKGIAPEDELERARNEASSRLKEGFSVISKLKCRSISRRRSSADPGSSD
jgi:hypothetical protein